MASYRQSGTVWQVSLSHAEVGGISDAAYVGSIATAWAPTVSAAILAVSKVIQLVDAIGWNNGVNIVGVLQTQLVTVTPAVVSPLGLVSRFAGELQRVTGLPGGVVGAGIGAGIALLAVGPAGVVVGGFAGALGSLIGDSGGANPGDVHANRTAVGAWERFLLVPQSPDRVAMSSWRGFFCAEGGGGGPVHANRHVVGDWERHRLIRNANGTVSFQSVGGHYLVAEGGGGGGSVCNWNRGAIGEWEQFWMEFQPDGTFALKTKQHNTYVSVQ